MDRKFHFIAFLLFIRYAISQNCDCKLVDILRNIVQREMMEREMLVSRVEMLESKQGSGTSNGAGSSGYSLEANILERLSVIETMIENTNNKLKETSTERHNGGRLYSALTDAWRIHKHALLLTNENIENKINDNNNRFNQLTREAEKSIEVVELKVESLINQTNEKASKQLKEVEDRIEVIHVGLNKTFKDYTTQMNTDFTRFVNKTDRMLNEISSDECASDPCKNGATCVDGIQRYTCICMIGYGGSQCQIVQDCTAIRKAGVKESGVYTVSLWKTKKEINVFCDMTSDNGGWTVFQNRFDGSVDFYQNFASYKNGFGHPSGEFWLGLKYVQEMTSMSQTELRIDMKAADGSTAYEVFQNFRLTIGPDYRLNIDPGTGTAGDSASTGMSYHKDSRFSTLDRDADNNAGHCANNCHGGWWYSSCCYVNINGHYAEPGTSSSYTGGWGGMIYYPFKQTHSLKSSKMMLRRVT